MQVKEKLKHVWVALLGTMVIAGCSSTATEPLVEQQPAKLVSIECMDLGPLRRSWLNWAGRHRSSPSRG